MTSSWLHLLKGWSLLNSRGDSGGALERALPEAINNAADQASRLKNTLRESAEGFARPINDVITRSIKYMLNSKAQGGMELSGSQIAGGAAVGAMGVYALSHILPGVVGRLVGRAGGVAAGVAQGKALQAAAGVTPVYVTNWAEMNGGGGAVGAAGGAAAAIAAGKLGMLRNAASATTLLAHAPLGVLAGSGAAGLAALAGGVGLAGAAGYGVGTGIYKFGMQGNKAGEGLGELVARFLSLFGNEEAKRSVAINDALKNSRVGGEITVRVQGNPNLAVQTEVRPFNGTRMNALGQTNLGAGE
ncbi:MAG: hypothetical protein Q8K91_00005 [Hylemonella sp.]|nr:hypothetical protein [Hylemonella sp.]MDP1935567.1 hypothetical protein [Hylemonella sp.]